MTLCKIMGMAITFTLITQPTMAQQLPQNDKRPEIAAKSHVDVMSPQNKPMIIAKVNGLVCDFCAQALKKVFKKEDGVKSLHVDLDAGEVRIVLKKGQTLSDGKVKTLIRKSGYSLVSTRREGGHE